jgi:MATE family, multidrug efflux pump
MALHEAIARNPAAAARTRLLLEGPIVSTLLRLAVPNLAVTASARALGARRRHDAASLAVHALVIAAAAALLFAVLFLLAGGRWHELA